MLQNSEPFTEGDCQLLRCHPPIWCELSPFFLDDAVGQPYKLEHRVIIRKHTLRLRHFAHLSVVALDDIRSVGHVADCDRILEVKAEILPLVTP